MEEQSNESESLRAQYAAKRNKSYTPTPRQLEALSKAREAKRLKKEQLEQSSKNKRVQFSEPVLDLEKEEDIDMRYVNSTSLEQSSKEKHTEPVQVVRDNKLVKEFIESERINAQETGLGKRRRDEPSGLKRLRELHVDLDDYVPCSGENGFLPNKKILLGVGVGVGCGLGLAYWLQKDRQISLKPILQQKGGRAFAQPSKEVPSEPSQPATPPPESHILKAPWER